MDFDEVYKRYCQNKATEEEIKYVEDFVHKARKIGAKKLNSDPEPEVVPAVVEPEKQPEVVEVEPQPVKYKWHDFKLGVRHFFTGLLVVLILVAILGVYGWFAGGAAAKATLNIKENEATSTALTRIQTQYSLTDNQTAVKSAKRHLCLCLPIDNSFYYYVVEITSTSSSHTYQVWVSGSYAGASRVMS